MDERMLRESIKNQVQEEKCRGQEIGTALHNSHLQMLSS
jgi:hypothetical protein